MGHNSGISDYASIYCAKLMWIQGKQLESFGMVNFESKAEALTETVSVPNWFSVDTKTGVRTLHVVSSN